MKKTIIGLILVLALINIAWAVDTCTPDSGYTSCYELIRPQTSGDASASATARIQLGDVLVDSCKNETIFTNGNAYLACLGNVRIPYKFTGDNLYVYNVSEPGTLQIACSETACIGGTEIETNTANRNITNSTITQTGEYVIASPGELPKCPTFLAYDYDYNSSGTNYAYSWAEVQSGWAYPRGECFLIAPVNCYENSDCSTNQTCNKTGTWDQWRCTGTTTNTTIHQCEVSSDCVHTPSYSTGFCSNNSMALVRNATRADCINYNCQIITYQSSLENCTYLCGVESGVSKCIAKVCDTNQLRCSTDGKNVEKCIGNAYSLSETCTYGCESAKCKGNPYIFPGEIFPGEYIGGAVLVIIVGYLLWRQYGKKRS